MKLVKLTLLAATAAVAATALIGASSASATPTWIGVCKQLELLNCVNLVKHPLNGKILALVGPGKFNSGFVTVECASGKGHSNLIASQQNGEFKGTLEELKFETCKGCTGVEVTTPQNVVVNMTEATGGWRLKTETTPGKVKFTGCPFGTTCIYEGNIDLGFEHSEKAGHKNAVINPNGFELKRGAGSGALCAEKGKWESGTTLLDWTLDDATPTIHEGVSPSLIGASLITVP
jgi:hypothetical protein